MRSASSVSYGVPSGCRTSWNQAFDVGLQLVVPLQITQDFCARPLNPLRIMNVLSRVGLDAGNGFRIPYAVEQDQHHRDPVRLSHPEEAIDPSEESLVVAIGLPHLELVDRGARHEVGADEPGLSCIPSSTCHVLAA